MTECLYETPFTLEFWVNDFEAAASYLQDAGNMAQYLDEPLKQIATKITWELLTEDSGRIQVQTTRELTDKENNELADWICGQCTDGLGEGFEQQDFASLYFDEHGDSYAPDEVYDDEDYEMEMASFSGNADAYALERVS